MSEAVIAADIRATRRSRGSDSRSVRQAGSSCALTALAHKLTTVRAVGWCWSRTSSISSP
jgi:hypothetical protein